MLTALAEGLDASAAGRVFGYRQATIITWLSRAGQHAQSFHEHFFCHLQLPYLQLDELRTRLRCAKQVLWLVIDPCTKILPVLHLGLRTQNAAHTVIHSLRRTLAPGCFPLFTSDGLNVYFYAFTAHFGHWLHVGRRGWKALRWQVATELIYGQVKKSYRCRELARVTSVMHMGTEAALKVVLQGLGFSGSLNTSFIERVNLTVRHGVAALARRTWATTQQATPVGPPGVVASVLSLCASSPSTPSGVRAAARARGQSGSATLSATDSSHGCRQNRPAMERARGARLPIVAGFRLRATEARGGCRVMSRGDW